MRPGEEGALTVKPALVSGAVVLVTVTSPGQDWCALLKGIGEPPGRAEAAAAAAGAWERKQRRKRLAGSEAARQELERAAAMPP
jgi:hypothetical protein